MCHSDRVSEPVPDAPAPVPATPPVNVSALLAEALTKSDICWLRTPTGSQLVWHAYDREAVLVVTGPGEQTIPELPEEVEIVLRSKDSGGRLLVSPAKVVVLPPDNPMWPAAAQALAAERLNATDDQIARWRESATIYVLHPFGMPLERPGEQDAASGAESFEPARGTTGGWRPAHLWGRGRKGR